MPATPTHYMTKHSLQYVLFSQGFRPFFLAAATYAIVAIIPWILYLSNQLSPLIPMQIWHGHEMLFGFVSAGITGFLLTAIPHWTNTDPLSGSKLRNLFLFWLSGRIVFWLFIFFDHKIFGYLLFIDLLLPIIQTIRITRIFVISKNYRNLIFSAIMAMLVSANLLVILELNNITTNTASIGAIFAPNVIMLTIAVIGGRVTPNFTRNYLMRKGIEANITSSTAIEISAIVILLLNILCDIIYPHTTISYFIAFVAFIIHTLRFSKWNSLKTTAEPLVWVLHLGYIWLLITLLLKASENLLELPYNLYLHSFTIGVVGTYLLGIMSRAALGHTGRKLQANNSMAIMYILVSAAAMIRIISPFFADYFLYGMILTTILWIFAFALYLIIFSHILLTPNIVQDDG